MYNICQGAGKFVSLEELEARMRGGIPPMSQPEPKPNKTEEDLSAFKKLVRVQNIFLYNLHLKLN